MITGTPNADALDGTNGPDTIDGLGGNDTINALDGDDILNGGDGNDTLNGNDGDDTLNGGAGKDLLRGGAGVDTLNGGLDDDTYIIDDLDDVIVGELSTEAGGGRDVVRATVSFTLPTNIEILTLGGSDALDGTGSESDNGLNGNGAANVLMGLGGSDTLNGNGGDDTLHGGDCDDFLNGGSGSDTLIGGDGGDRYTLNDANDTIIELASDSGIDTMRSSIDATIVDNVERLVLIGSALEATGNGDDNTLQGNGLDNILTGGAGNDVLLGSSGNDTLLGGDGNDTLDGGKGDDTLDGGEGDDLFVYAGADGDGADTMLGGTGADRFEITNPDSPGGLADLTLDGGGGGDTLVVDAATLGNLTFDGGSGNDAVAIKANTLGTVDIDLASGVDTVELGRVDGVIGALGGDISIRLGGGRDAVIIADLPDTLVIRDFATGASGDTLDLTPFLARQLSGWDGSNPFGTGHLRLVQSGTSVLLEVDFDGGGDSWSLAATLSNTDVGLFTSDNFLGFDPGGAPASGGVIDGTSVGETLDGGIGADTLNGFGGDDTLNGEGGPDILNGGDGDDVLNGGIGDDTLNGDAGADIMSGGLGSDTYSVDDAGDQIVGEQSAAEGGGTDVVFSSVSFTLPEFVEILTLTGGAAIDGTGTERADSIVGNAGDNVLLGLGGDDSLFGNEGDDTLDGGAGHDFLMGGIGDDIVDGGAGDDLIAGGPGADTLDGGEGVDTLSYLDAAGRIVVRLWNQTADGSDASADTISGFENVQSGAGNDALIGSADANFLSAGAGNDYLDGLGGNDWLVGGAGADRMVGGEGEDTLIYLDATGRVVVRLWNQTADGSIATGDEISGFEHIASGSGNDALIGSDVSNILFAGAGNDYLDGLGGDDVLLGGVGADRLVGGDGTDTVSYGDAVGRVVVRLWNQTAEGSIATGDTLSGFENVEGGAGNDALIGSSDANIIWAGAGNDYLDGLGGDDVLIGGAGADRMVGGDGVDTLSYEDALGRVVVRLWNQTADGSIATGDEVSGFENVTGGAGNDALIGSDEANVLTAGAGDDYLDGLGGDDVLSGGEGEDRMVGGEGVDTVSYADADGRVVVRLRDQTADGSIATGDTLSGFENATTGSGNDALIGSDVANVLTAGAGNDYLDGLAGDDVIDGGAGNDRMVGGAGADTFVISQGADTIFDFSAVDGDRLDLSGVEEIDTLADLQAAHSQVGDDSVFDLGDGNTLTVEDTTLGDFSDSVF
ncbi:MAG: calcium-binding protein [Pseudomonadota bacterium]